MGRVATAPYGCIENDFMKKIHIPHLQVDCAYRVHGNGPGVVLIHGLCDSGEAWEKQVPLLARHYRVLVPDLPGYGHSQPFPDGNFALERLQQAVFAVADAEGMERFSVIGHSMGGYTALAMLEAQPGRMDALCLFHSTSRGDTEEKKKGRDKSVRVLHKNRDLFFREVFKNLFNQERLPQFMPMVRHMYEQSARLQTETVVNTLLALRDRKDRYALLQNAQIPVSYFMGRHDNVLPADTLVAEAESLGVPYHVSEVSGHMAFHESPAEVEKYLLDFLAKAHK